IGQPGTGIEAEQLCYRHPEVREPVRVHGKPLQLHVALTHGAFDGRGHLAAVQHDRLAVDDRPLIQQVRVAADGISAASRIKARVPQMTCRLRLIMSEATRHLWNARLDPRRRTYAVGSYTHLLDQWTVIYGQPIVLNRRQVAAAIEGAMRQRHVELE